MGIRPASVWKMTSVAKKADTNLGRTSYGRLCYFLNGHHCDEVRYWHLADIGVCAANVRTQTRIVRSKKRNELPAATLF